MPLPAPSDDINFSEPIIKELYRKQFNTLRRLRLIKESEVNQWLSPTTSWNDPWLLQWVGNKSRVISHLWAFFGLTRQNAASWFSACGVGNGKQILLVLLQGKKFYFASISTGLHSCPIRDRVVLQRKRGWKWRTIVLEIISARWERDLASPNFSWARWSVFQTRRYPSGNVEFPKVKETT